MATETPAYDEKEFLVEAKKGARVFLLEPHHDGVRIIPAETEIAWYSDVPPTRRQARLAKDRSPTPLDAPAMTSGKPAEGQIDPTTGKPYVLPPRGSV